MTTKPKAPEYVYAVAFEVADIPGDTLPSQPAEPLPPSPDADAAEQAVYAEGLVRHLEAVRVYNGNVAAMLASEEYWRTVRTEMPDREAAEAQVREVLLVHTANPLVRNIGLDRAVRPEWERVELSPTT